MIFNLKINSLILVTSLLLLLSSLALIQSVSAIGTDIIGNTPLCFLEHLNPQSTLSVRYTFPNLGSSGNPTSVLITITDPIGNEVFSQERTQVEVQVNYETPANQQGQYLICLLARVSSLSTFMGAKAYRIELQIDSEDYSKHYAKLESKDRLEQLNGLLETLKDKLGYIEDEQHYFKEREERFRVTSDTIASRILWYGGGVTCVLIVLSAWQVYTMRSFFKSKKLA